MSWNKPSSVSQPPPKKSTPPSLKRGLLAGLLVVALGALCYFMFRPSAATPKRDSMKDRGLIKEVTPAAAPKSKAEKPAPKPAAPEKFVPPKFPADMDPEERDVKLRRAKWEWKLTHDMRLRNFLEKHKPPEATFKTGEEQVIDWIFTCKVGDDVPPPLPQMQEFEKNHLLEILETACEVKEDDDAETVERKKIVDDVKKELAEYVKQGGRVQNFLEYYRNELVKARETKALVASEVRKAIDSGDPDVGVQTLDKGNKILRDKGISEVELDAGQIETLQDGLNKQKGQNK